MFSFYKKCQSDKATALELTFFCHKASFGCDKIRRKRIITFSSYLGDFITMLLSLTFFISSINLLIICSICAEPAFIIFFSKGLDSFCSGKDLSFCILCGVDN